MWRVAFEKEGIEMDLSQVPTEALISELKLRAERSSVAGGKKKPPSLLLHKASGQARVRINGKDIYLGPFGSEQARVEYAAIVNEWSLHSVPVPPGYRKCECGQGVVAKFEWTKEMEDRIGTISDYDLARELGIKRMRVVSRRMQLGKKAFVKFTPRAKWTPEHLAKLGIVDDDQLADELNITVGMVARKRLKQGIGLRRGPAVCQMCEESFVRKYGNEKWCHNCRHEAYEYVRELRESNSKLQDALTIIASKASEYLGGDSE